MRYVYGFDEDSSGGRELLGGKGIGLAEMTQLGSRSGRVHDHDRCLPRLHASRQAVPGRARRGGRRAHRPAGGASRQALRRPGDPLLVSVRSGAAVSMPGMMDTILNLGLNDTAIEGLAAPHRQRALRVRLVPAVDPDVRRGRRRRRGAPLRGGARGAEARAGRLAGRRAHRGRPSGAGRRVQADLRGGDGRRVPAGSPRAAAARRSAPCSTRGTRRGRRSTGAPTRSPTTSAPPSTSSRWSSATRATGSGTGVCFTRDPATGEARLFGEFLANAQGEDVVAGIRTPEPIEAMQNGCRRRTTGSSRHSRRLEAHYREMQDVEFTVEEGALFLLQTRTGKRTAAAACGSWSRWWTKG